MVLTTVNGLVAGDPIVDGTGVNQARAFQSSIPTQALGSYVTPLASDYNFARKPIEQLNPAFDALACIEPGAVVPLGTSRVTGPIDAFNPVQPFQQIGLSTWSSARGVYKAFPGNVFGATQPRAPYNVGYQQTGLSRWQAIDPDANPALPDATDHAVIGSSIAYANLPEVSAPIG